MKDLLLHQQTSQAANNFLKMPSHALLIIGATGSGKACLAQNLLEQLLGVKDLDAYPYHFTLVAEKASIGIESIRQLEGFMSLKVPRPSPINRTVIIENAQKLTIEAQNALLKTLEEPPSGTIIILTVDHLRSLLPTVSSRAQLLDVKRPTMSNLENYFKPRYESKQISQAYSISGGLPGLMSALLSQTDHPLLEATEQARSWLRASPNERLQMVDSLSRQKILAEDMISILQQMARVSLQTATGRSAKRWHIILDSSFRTHAALLQSAQPKLALANLALAF
jgi:hypothetical protein